MPVTERPSIRHTREQAGRASLPICATIEPDEGHSSVHVEVVVGRTVARVTADSGAGPPPPYGSCTGCGTRSSHGAHPRPPTSSATAASAPPPSSHNLGNGKVWAEALPDIRQPQRVLVSRTAMDVLGEVLGDVL